MARRPTTDAKIILERAGYRVSYSTSLDAMYVYEPFNRLPIKGGTVDNDEIMKLLDARGCDELGRFHSNDEDIGIYD